MEGADKYVLLETTGFKVYNNKCPSWFTMDLISNRIYHSLLIN